MSDEEKNTTHYAHSVNGRALGEYAFEVTDEGVLLSPFFFDPLHLDGRDLLDEPRNVRLDALAGLLASDRHAVLRMPGVPGPSPEQAAEVLRIPVGTARTHYKRGKTRMRQLLSADGDER